MCGRYRVSDRAVSRLERWLKSREALALGIHENHAPTMAGPVLRSGHDAVELLRWGFNATSGPGSSPRLLINARSETVHKLRSFSKAWRERRCLVPADWFFEWDQATKPKQPWRFVRDSDEPMVIAGIWSPSRLPDGAVVDSYAVLTTDANEVVAAVHDRMPVILHERDWQTWLDPDTPPDQLQSLHRPFDGPMYAKPVDPAMNKSTYQGPVHDVVLQPGHPPVPSAQGELF